MGSTLGLVAHSANLGLAAESEPWIPYPSSSPAQRSFAADVLVAECSLATLTEGVLSVIGEPLDLYTSPVLYGLFENIVGKIRDWKENLPTYMDIHTNTLPSVTFLL